MITELFKEEAKATIEHLGKELFKLRTGRANAEIVSDIQVESYGAMLPLQQIATITIPEPRTIAIQPWDKSNIKAIEKALLEADLGTAPNNNGEQVLINLPPLTEETRQQLAKVAKQKGEEAKISVRNIREEVLKNLKNEEFSEDEEKKEKEELQTAVTEQNTEIETIIKEKEKEIMTV